MTDVVGRITQLTVIHDACEDDGLVRLDCEHGSFMVSPCIKAEADAHRIASLKAKIAAWVEAHIPYPSNDSDLLVGSEAVIFRVMHVVANVKGKPFTPFYRAEIGDHGPDGFNQALCNAVGGFLLEGRGPTELAALEALDAELKKLDDYE